MNTPSPAKEGPVETCERRKDASAVETQWESETKFWSLSLVVSWEVTLLVVELIEIVLSCETNSALTFIWICWAVQDLLLNLLSFLAFQIYQRRAIV